MKKKSGLSYGCYRVVRALIQLFYPKTAVYGTENLPEEPCIIVGNHAQMHGPITSELYLPGEHDTWCAGQMMELKEVPAYAFEDFWRAKPKSVRWFYKGLSYVIAPLSVCIFNNARTIPVYHDARVVGTFKRTVSRLEQGASVVIFPESRQPHNHIVNDFQDRFIDIAKIYYKRTGKTLSFVPLYIAPGLRGLYLGKPVQYNIQNPAASERLRIKEHLMQHITRMAVGLPLHTVVPYSNIPKNMYPVNIPSEVTHPHETARR